ncbi:MAG: NADH-quinone oxidoreductase subunit L [Planctomycetes bacterium]|nr:NADH-quinone oxidoreductase subunit L [Planctomycetota bacterium]
MSPESHFLAFDPAQDFKLLFLALVIPLVGYVIQIFLGKRLPRQGDWLLTAGLFLTASITVLMFAKSLWAAYHGQEFRHHSGDEAGLWFHWLYSSAAVANGTPNVSAAIFYDPLGAAMLMVVGVVSFCVHLFSIGYMHGTPRYHIFFANISLFTFAMLGLVLSDNLLFLFIFWELMGLMSYLLIGHFSHDPSSGYFHKWATKACKKAFLTTRVGDTCLLFGMLIFFWKFETFRFTELWRLSLEEIARYQVNNPGEYPLWMTVGGLFVFGGTIGKSAQFPLHIWLPDAMAGPTPVSAMIHAATMVAAGVFLLGRCYPMFTPDVLSVVAAVGTLTALFAATIGTTAYDLKAVLAWSTISQLGFMVAAIGLGGVVAGLFHMVTHAFFKACLFLSAGSVIHGCHHEQDMRNMGGVRKYMPITFMCMLAATIAIAGIPFFSGFYSKDMIILRAWENVLGGKFSGASFFAAIALPIAACCTAFYMFRMIFMTFFGEYRPGTVESPFSHHHADHGDDAHHGAGHAEHGHAQHGHAQHGHAEHGASHQAAHAAHGSVDHGHGHGKTHSAAGHHTEHTAGHTSDHGSDHGHATHPHESPAPIVIALCVLATLGVLGGHFWLADPLHSLKFWEHAHTWFEQSVSFSSLYGHEIGEKLAAAVEVDEHAAHAAHSVALSVSLAVALSGIFIAWLIYGRGWERSQRIAGRITHAIHPLYVAVAGKYFVDEVAGTAIVVDMKKDEPRYEPDISVIGGSMMLANTLSWVDRNIVDALVNLVGRTGLSLGRGSAKFDSTVVDGAVNGVGLLTQTFGSLARLFQSGRVQQYATFAVFGGLMLAAWLILL